VGPTIQMIGGPRRKAQISQKAEKVGWNIGIQLNKQDDKIDFFND